MSALAELRRATASDHAMVDAAFGDFDLSNAAAYGRFLTAHARALPAVEAALAGVSGLPPLRSRTPLLEKDLAELGLEMPPTLVVEPPVDHATAFGMAYVIEGSRLGGGMLAKRVPEALPHAYLSAVHLPGEWRAFGQALDAAAGDDAAWIARAGAAANRTFNLYREAASI